MFQVLWRATAYVGCADASQPRRGGGMCHTQVCRYAKPGETQLSVLFLRYNEASYTQKHLWHLQEIATCPNTKRSRAEKNGGLNLCSWTTAPVAEHVLPMVASDCRCICFVRSVQTFDLFSCAL